MNKTKANLLLLTAAFIWGSTFIAQSSANNYLGPYTFVALRFVIAAITILPVALYSCKKNKNNKTNSEYKTYLSRSIIGGLLGGIALGAATIFQQVGIVYTNPDKAGFLTSLYIVMVPLIGVLFKQKFSKNVWIAVVIATIGFYFLSVKDNFVIENGDIFLILCALVFAIQIIVVSKFSDNTNSFLLTNMQFVSSAIISIVMMLINENCTFNDVLKCIFPLLYSAILASAVADCLQVVAQKYCDTSTASLLMSLESVFAALCSGIILNTKLSQKELIGCLLIFIAVVLSQVSFKELKRIIFKTTQ